MSNVSKIIVTTLCILFIVAVLFFSATPTGRGTWNRWFFAVQKADDATAYSTKKSVEDTCRAMIASYTSDKLTYEQYKDSDKDEKIGWAEQAKMRANKTAASYNEYVLKNSFVWSGNVQADIQMQLAFLQ